MKVDLAKLLIWEEQYWKQRAKSHWLKSGDLNTIFYHQLASARKKRNTLARLFDESGTWTTDPGGLEKIVISYFSDLFTPSKNNMDIDWVTSYIRGCITDEDNCQLGEPFDPNEFKTTDFQMHKDKLPEPDGFNPGFCKKFWNIVGPELVHSYTAWLEAGCFPDMLNETTVVLITKCDNPQTVKDLRPISLYNVVYKIVSEVLCDHLKRVLPDLINESQSAFISGRLIQDILLIAFETTTLCRRRGKGKWVT